MRVKDRPLLIKLLLEAFINSRGVDGCMVKSWNVRRQHLFKLGARRATHHVICENLIELIDSGEFTAAQLSDPRSLSMVRSCMHLIRTIVDEAHRGACNKKLRLKLTGPHQILAGCRGVGLICDQEAWTHVEGVIRRMQNACTPTACRSGFRFCGSPQQPGDWAPGGSTDFLSLQKGSHQELG